jgi:hypothetical protein
VRTLERAWEEKLRELERLEREYETRPRPKLLTLTADEHQKILNLAQDLPALWHAQTTTNQERKQLLRLLIKDITLKKDIATIHIAIRWQTDEVTSLDIERPHRSSETRKNKQPLITYVRQLAKTHTDHQIVDILNQKGIRSATGKIFNVSMIRWIRWTYNIPLTCLGGPTEKRLERRSDGLYSTQATANRLGVTISTIIRWCKEGKLDGKQDVAHGPWWIQLDPKIAKELRQPLPPMRHRTGG